MRTRRAIEALNIGLILSTIAVSIAVWSRLPERLPVHWSGVAIASVDGYGGRAYALLFYPGILVASYPLLLFAHKIDPDRYERVRGSLGWALVRLAVTALFAADHYAYVLYLTGHAVDFIAVGRDALLGLLAVCAVWFVWQMVQEHRRPSPVYDDSFP